MYRTLIYGPVKQKISKIFSPINVQRTTSASIQYTAQYTVHILHTYSSKMASIKVMLVGNSGIGKTAWCNRNFRNKCASVHVPTLGVEMTPTVFGDIPVNIWEVAGDSRFMGLGSGYCIDASAAIIFAKAEEDENTWRKFLQIAGAIPVLVANPKKSEISMQDLIDLIDRAT